VGDEEKKMRRKIGRGNWLLMFLVLVGMVVLVMASPSWNEAEGGAYSGFEDTPFFYNFSANVTNSVLGMVFSFYSINNYNSSNSNLELLFPWISLNSSSGMMKINSTNNSQSGIFNISVSVVDPSKAGSVGPFVFNISSVNDAPVFTELVDGGSYQFNESSVNLIRQYNATDEEGEVNYSDGYPLSFDYNISWCNSTLSATDCNDLLNLSLGSNNKSMILNFTLANDYVGYYNVSFWMNDSYDAQTGINVTFEVVNVNDAPNVTFACDNNRDMVEDEVMSCWVNATDIDESNNLTFAISSGLAQFTFNDSTKSYVYICSGVGQCNASANVTFVLNDSTVGNWSVNISVTDTALINTVGWANFSFFVDNVEDLVYVDDVADFWAFENITKGITAYDDDFLVSDSQSSVEDERLNFSSNNSAFVYFRNVGGLRVSSLSNLQEDGNTNHRVVTAYVDWDAMNRSGLVSGENVTINISVVDTAGNYNWTVFSMIFDNSNNFPVWNSSAIYNFSIEEDNSSWGGINLSDGYVSDADGENITFYYVNYTQFNDFNLSNSSGSWVINFTPGDVDVGYHGITVYASDGNVNVTHQFNFTIDNVDDTPVIYDFYRSDNSTTISNGSTVLVSENNATTFILIINDDDFLIPSAQRSYYNESLNVGIIVTNLTGGSEDLFNFSFVEFGNPSSQSVSYNATFTPNISHVGDYLIFVNISDSFGVPVGRSFYLNISASLEAPVLDSIDNVSVTINDYVDFSVTATDNEDDYNGINLSFFIERLNVSAPNLSIGNETGRIEFNLSFNESYAGIWGYNVTVNDSDGMTDVETFYIYIYGNATLVSPISGSVFNLTENITGVLNFTISHSVGDNLTYEFWIDSISCGYQNSSDCSYENLVFRNMTSSFGDGSVFGWVFTPNFTDESYRNYKNLTVVVYPNVTTLNSSQRLSVVSNFSFKLNISHTNAPIVFVSAIGNSQANYDQDISYDLGNYFSDVDSDDSYYLQSVNLTILSNVSSSNIDANSVKIPANISYNNWGLVFSTGYNTAFSELVNVTALDISFVDNSSLTSATSNNFKLTFTAPTVTETTVPTPTSGGSSTRLKYFSLRIVVPQDVIISDENYIEVPFSLQNAGTVDLNGISLTSEILYDGQFSDNIRVEVNDTFIPILRVGEKKDYSMKIFVDTHKAGKYRATIFANVASPKLTDWGYFFIELKKINETEADNILIFTEKLISENPQCLELTELLNQAREAFNSGDFSTALNLAREAQDACREAIASNEQIKYPIIGLVRDNFYYISFLTLVVFVLGFIFYVYKRIRFNKYKVNELQ